MNQDEELPHFAKILLEYPRACCEKILLDGAIALATSKHSGQVRKYTGEPYITHPIAVASIVGHSKTTYGVSMNTMKTVAILHDVLEDCGVTYDELVSSFGLQVAFGVLQLSDILQVGNRASRKEQTRLRLKNSPGWVQTIKCADIIHNCPSIMKHDPKFAVTYIPECKALLDVMDKADEYLLGVAFDVISGAGIDVS